MTRELTGRHVLIIAVTAFGIIIAANMTMLFSATGTFPGLVVKNSYVASQGWNARTEAQVALGWTAELDYGQGALTVRLLGADGAPVPGQSLDVTIGRPTTDIEDQVLTLTETAGAYIVPVELGRGAWRIELRSTEPAFARNFPLMIADPG